MSEYPPLRQTRQAEDYADRDRDADAQNDAWEPTYRDGSAKNECWHSDGDA